MTARMILFGLIFLVSAVRLEAFLVTTLSRTHRMLGRVKLSEKDDERIEDLDWRDFRAKLVLGESREDGWVFESGGVIEKGSLIVSAPSQEFSFGGLKQQYFHKACLLIVEHDERVFTRGLLLNRPTLNRKVNDEYGNSWSFRYGGPLGGLASDDITFFCLHRIPTGNKSCTEGNKDTANNDVDMKSLLSDLSIPINKDIAVTKWDVAQAIVASGEANVDDFILIAGYCGWNPGQLNDEMNRNNWYSVSIDSGTLFETIKRQDDSSIPEGTDMWVNLMTRIGKGSMTSYTFKNKANVRFEDAMLQQWVRQRLADTTSDLAVSLSTKSEVADNPADKPQDSSLQHSSLIPPGTIVRATTPILLDDQVFHKSLVLIIENTIERAVGVVLNRPSTETIEVMNNKLPIRYGGSFGTPAEGKQMIWLHCNNEALQEAQVGKPLFPMKDRRLYKMFWKCNQEDVETACEIGLATPKDFLVVKGVSVWQRQHRSTLPKQSKSISYLEDCFSEIDTGAIPTVWKLLLTQQVLDKNNAAENLETANAAWLIAGDASWLLSGFRSHVSQEKQSVQDLANSALDRWIKTFLL